jgi:hypothetical protein
MKNKKTPYTPWYHWAWIYLFALVISPVGTIIISKVASFNVSQTLALLCVQALLATALIFYTKKP